MKFLDNKIKSQDKGVMFNAYPDSIGENFSYCIEMLQLPEFYKVFSLFYLLPTCFNSDLDRGFSIIDYNLNENIISQKNLSDLNQLNILLKFDIVLNHLSVASPQFKDLLVNGQDSKYKDFFINWNDFWKGQGEKNQDGVIVPKQDFLEKLFMRKSGLPVLNVPFPNGKHYPFWNTFYQEIIYTPITTEDVIGLEGMTIDKANSICDIVNNSIQNSIELKDIDFGVYSHFKISVISILKQNCTFLGQMDVNANSNLVWDFYDKTISKLNSYGCKVLRLDAFAYLHKQVGLSNFFNEPGTWDYLERITHIANRYDIQLLPEIHAEYGAGIHEKVAEKGFKIYDFFLPGLIIHTLEKNSSLALLKWAQEIITKKYDVVNMLGCHDGIPVLDLKGKHINSNYNKGLLSDKDIESVMSVVLERGGRVKNLFGADGKKISYYQINATFYSALGEVDQKLLLARAIQLFMPGIPQIWYLDLFAGKNDYKAVENALKNGHKEINRTNLSLNTIKKALKTDVVKNQIKLIKIRNNHKAFLGRCILNNTSSNQINIVWENEDFSAELKACLEDLSFTIILKSNDDNEVLKF